MRFNRMQNWQEEYGKTDICVFRGFPAKGPDAYWGFSYPEGETPKVHCPMILFMGEWNYTDYQNPLPPDSDILTGWCERGVACVRKKKGFMQARVCCAIDVIVVVPLCLLLWNERLGESMRVLGTGSCARRLRLLPQEHILLWWKKLPVPVEGSHVVHRVLRGDVGAEHVPRSRDIRLWV